jgi:oligopeptide/dipeptide ABC transporter ATP-binding protein
MSALGPLLAITDLRVTFPTRRSLRDIVRFQRPPRLIALDGVSIAVPTHGTVGVVGESGSGKSTLAKAVVRLVEPESGSIHFDGTDLLRANGRELRDIRRRLQMVYQDPYSSLNPRLRVGETIMEPAKVHGLVARDRASARLAELMDQVGLAQKIASRLPRELSGGQRQRVAIARALACEPRLLIADEVVSALDVSIQAQILNLFADLQRELGLTMVFIAHQLPVVAHIADHVAVMYLGRIVEYGPCESVFNNPQHPYTAALLAAQPSRARRGPRTPALSGEIPSPLAIPDGCRFRTRCPHALPHCAAKDPEPRRVGESHHAWCHLATEAALPVEPGATESLHLTVRPAPT